MKKIIIYESPIKADKTIESLINSHTNQIPILCNNEIRKTELQSYAKQLNLKIPVPVTKCDLIIDGNMPFGKVIGNYIYDQNISQDNRTIYHHVKYYN